MKTQPAIDAELYARNHRAARGILARMDPMDRSTLLDKMGVTRELDANDRERIGAETLAYYTAAAGQDVLAGARAAAGQMSPALWRDLEARYRRAPGAQNYDTIPLEGSGRKRRKPGPFRAIQNEVGRGLIRAGKEVKRWTKAPVVGQYLIGPMGAEVIGETLAQIGHVARGGSIRDWDDRAFVLALGHTMASTGQALIAASPFLPAPWNAAALAAGTASLMIGKLATSHVKAQEAKDRAAQSFEGGESSELPPEQAALAATPGAEPETLE